MTPLKEILVDPTIAPDGASSVKFDKSQVGSCDFIRITPYVQSNVRYVIYILLCIASCGVLIVLSTWWPQLFTVIARRKSHSKKTAHFLLIESDLNIYADQYEEVVVHHSHKDPDAVSILPYYIIWFEHKKARYVYNNETKEYERINASLHEHLMNVNKRLHYGYSQDQVDAMQYIFGGNTIPIIPTRADKILIQKICHPFYLFQIFSCIIWISNQFTEYAAIILILSAGSIMYEVSSQVNNMRRLRDLGIVDTQVNVRKKENVF